MAAGSYSFTIEQGTTLNKVLTWKDNQVTPQPINLTGYTARMQVRPSQSSSTINHEFTTENGGITLGGALGTITITASAIITAGWTWTIPSGQTKPQGVYDLELVDGSGSVTRLIQGTITLDPEVTR